MLGEGLSKDTCLFSLSLSPAGSSEGQTESSSKKSGHAGKEELKEDWVCVEQLLYKESLPLVLPAPLGL